MLFEEALPFVKEFVAELNAELEEYKPGEGLSYVQRKWLEFCLMGIVVTNSVCWAKFERASLGQYTFQALSWMFRYSKIPWERLLLVSVRAILKRYGISWGNLVADDSDKQRSKITKRIFGVHKQKDKVSGGYVMGQTIVLLLLVTEEITIPVGFSFYRPDPALQAWKKEDKRLKKMGVSKKTDHQSPGEILAILLNKIFCCSCYGVLGRPILR